MPLPHVSQGDIHVLAHNDERDAINLLQDTLTDKADLESGIILESQIPTRLSTSGIQATLEDEVEAAVAGHTPGVERAFAEVAYGGSGTQVFSTLYHWTPLLLSSIAGQGRRVDIIWNIPLLYHSVANTGVVGVIYSQKDGGSLVVEQAQIGFSPATTNGPGMIISAAKTLDEGSSYNFAFYMAGMAAGTWSAGGGGGLRKMTTSVISR